MGFPERFSNLPAYAFPRLRALLDHHPAGGDVVHMTIGEPKHPMPDFVAAELAKHVADFGRYPPNDGAPELLTAIADWIELRYDVSVDSTSQIIALNGTREGLFAAGLSLVNEQKNGRQANVLIPNPFYQVYAVATNAVGANPVFVPAMPDNNFLPDYSALPNDVLAQTSACFICSPSNPQGAIATSEYWEQLINLAEKHDFQIFADECYSEIYREAPPIGALQVAKKLNADPERVVIFHSLSKRSNLPGLRSGFAAGGPDSIGQMRKLRAYGGAPLPLPLQRIATQVWMDETHVEENRVLYQQKYKLADEIFESVQGYVSPQAGFFLWLPVDDGEAAALRLWKETGVRVLPGRYLTRETDGIDPGSSFIRVAMVAPIEETKKGLQSIRDCLF